MLAYLVIIIYNMNLPKIRETLKKLLQIAIRPIKSRIRIARSLTTRREILFCLLLLVAATIAAKYDDPTTITHFLKILSSTHPS
jgi:hypothetical protein